MPDPSPPAPAGGARPDDGAQRAAPPVPRRMPAEAAGVLREPSHAERARTLLAEQRTAALSTVAAGSGGMPFGSLVRYAVDERGRPLLCLSDLAEHTRNLAEDPRASVLVTEGGDGDPLALGRVTLLGEVSALSGAERDRAAQRYQAAHPDARAFGDFRLYRLAVSSVRYIGGFGRMSWVDPAEYAAALPDPLHPYRSAITAHMNDDHADALVSFCRVLAGRPDTVTARMVDVDRYGFVVLAAASGATGPATPGAARPVASGAARPVASGAARPAAAQAPAGGEPDAVRFGFEAPADTPAQVRAAMVELVRRARALAGS